MIGAFLALESKGHGGVNGGVDGVKFVAVNAPTGAGKSGIAVALANARGGRAVVCTSTKPLQRQYLDDFSSAGLVDIRGRANYPCHLGNGTTCEEGIEEGCPNAAFCQCPYRAAYLDACSSATVVTNYAYWATVHRYAEGLGETDLLVCDEAHTAFDEVCGVMGLEFWERDIAFLLGSRFPAHDLGLEGWKQWASAMSPIAAKALVEAERLAKSRQERALFRRARRIKTLARSLSDLQHAQGEWVFGRRRLGQGEMWTADPVWAAPYAAPVLFDHAGKVLLISATVTRRTMELLGLMPDQYKYLEIPSQFPPASSPVYYIPTVAMHQGMSHAEEAAMYNRIDEIVTVQGPRKGIIHTVSYDRAEQIASACRTRGVMILHERGGAGVQAGIDLFRASRGPAVLVSPAITMGFDFAGEASEYQILPKIPFPDSTNHITRARTAADLQRPRTAEDKERKQLGTDYLDYAVSQVLIQACGRSTRTEQDRCTTYILDDNWKWWRWRAERGGCFPWWFRRLLKMSRTVPPPLPPLRPLPHTRSTT
jgi:Rad3-related DNA helicase